MPLVNQQAEYFRSQLSNSFLPDKESHHVECLTGDRNVDVWKNEKWNSVLSSCTVSVHKGFLFTFFILLLLISVLSLFLEEVITSIIYELFILYL